MYSSGEGVPQDYVKAREWFGRPAERGYSEAQTAPACMYAPGKGVPGDDVQACAWFNIAAAQGDPHAEKMKNQIADSVTRESLAGGQELAQRYCALYVLAFQN